ncbi:glycoside hydrolase superfamily [Dendryphion nanum]|uniref:Alpha-galactosidase n=1 Tax=Dendryphion nanum TaxID=256645 RepID=A0A9P9IFF3_9PLEO|nr:glycoside hydrolase superfamily [Dendryphion nanum]
MAHTKLFIVVASLVLGTTARTVRSPTPPMGWNSYNTYSCSPSEDKIKHSAQGLVSLGLDKLGYDYVTVDCGWPARDRDANGKLQWNATLFPSGGRALGDYIHDIGLNFGLYSGAGFLQCGSTDLPASLGFEQLDAESFAEWGGDSLKYDNCYSTSRTVMVDSDSAESQSPVRFQHMALELEAVNRDIQYFVCQWGIGTDTGHWAAKIGTSWRISNDIYNAWRSIWRITNQVVPYYKHTTVGAFADMDMLIVGLNALSEEEERFHFGMWAIAKSPLIIGAALDPEKLPKSSLAILSNTEVIALNQDPLAKQAQLVRRYTEEEWDIWLGELNGSRQILGVANWKNDSQTVRVDLKTLGIASAKARNVWAGRDVGVVSGTQTLALAGHELHLLLLSDIVKEETPKGSEYHAAKDASLSGSARFVPCAGGSCQPTQVKVGNVGPGASVSFSSITSQTSGKKLIGVDFVNYDYAFKSAWEYGDNARNMTIAVNGGKAKRWAFPLSGGNWEEGGRLVIEVDGFVKGSNNVSFGAFGSNWAPDLIGIEILE